MGKGFWDKERGGFWGERSWEYFSKDTQHIMKSHEYWWIMRKIPIYIKKNYEYYRLLWSLLFLIVLIRLYILISYGKERRKNYVVEFFDRSQMPILFLYRTIIVTKSNTKHCFDFRRDFWVIEYFRKKRKLLKIIIIKCAKGNWKIMKIKSLLNMEKLKDHMKKLVQCSLLR